MQETDFVVSFEGVGASGKSTQARILVESLLKDFDVALDKCISRTNLEEALYLYREMERERLWVTNLPKVEPGVEMLAFLAMLKQAYAQKKSKIRVFDRYVDTVFTIAATKIVLSHENRPEEKICRLQDVFFATRGIIRWPDLTIYIDIPLEEASGRMLRREGRTYTEEDYKNFEIAGQQYRRLIEHDPQRFLVVDGRKGIKEQAVEILNAMMERYKRKMKAMAVPVGE